MRITDVDCLHTFINREENLRNLRGLVAGEPVLAEIEIYEHDSTDTDPSLIEVVGEDGEVIKAEVLVKIRYVNGGIESSAEFSLRKVLRYLDVTELLLNDCLELL